VFFIMDKYGYFVVHLRSMHVQQLSGVHAEYTGVSIPSCGVKFFNFLAFFVMHQDSNKKYINVGWTYVLCWSVGGLNF
jgi:hypothetical protein